MDLATEWRSRRWRRLLNIIERLPRTSYYIEAVVQDDQLADRMAAQPDPETKPQRRMADWSAQVELLTGILNRIGELTQAVAALGGAKPHKVSPAPVPQTALDRARSRRRFENHRRLVDRVLPRNRAGE